MEITYALLFLTAIITFGLLICKLDDHSKKVREKKETDKTTGEYQSMYNTTKGKQIIVKDGKTIIK